MNEYENYTPENQQSEPVQEPQTPPSYTPPVTPPVYEAPKPKKQKRRPSALAVIALALVFGVLGGIIGATGTTALLRFLPGTTSTIQQSQRENVELEVKPIEPGKVMTPAEVYAANVGSTVGITTATTINFWGYESTSAASGSGFIISDDGYIITNFHVVENSNEITVTLYDDTQYKAKLVGYDENNDLAVIKVDATGLTPVVIGSSDALNVGDTVMAIGNPLGELTFSLTVGTVSAKDRRITLSNSVTMDLLQTDCAINSGNSGGALFNSYGEVVGITNAKYSSSGYSSASIDNIGFAIPIDNVMDLVEGIIEQGYITKAYIGVSVTSVSEDATKYGIPKGAYVESVTEGSPAEKGGLQAGDIITAADGETVTTGSELVSHVGKIKVGDTVVLTVYRGGETLEISVVTEEHIQSTEPQTAPAASQQQQQQSQQMMPFFDFPFGFFNW